MVIANAVRDAHGAVPRVEFAVGATPTATAIDEHAETSEDDEVLDSATGLDAVTKALGGTVISEYDTKGKR